MPTIDATVGGASANSYATLVEANTYFDERLPLSTPWITSGDTSIRALIMATRILGAFAQSRRELISCGCERFYRTSRTWTGAPATTTQRLAWPRTGMYDPNGNAIDSATIPHQLKEAQAELAGQLIMADTTLDNAVSVAGITSVKAGSVAVTFKDMIERHVLPDAVWMLMPKSWFTDEVFEGAMLAQFDVVSD